MKKIICAAAALLIAAGSAWADEGMWLLPLLKQMNAKALAEDSVITLVEDYNFAVKYNYVTSSVFVR